MIDESHMLHLLSQRHSGVSSADLPRWVYAEQVPLVDAHRRIDAIALDSFSVPLAQRKDWARMAGIPFTDLPSVPQPPNDVHGFEVKVSRADWLSEHRTRGEKSKAWRTYCSHWWIVVPDVSILKEDELPQEWGVLAGKKRLVVKKPALRTLYKPLPQNLLTTIARHAVRKVQRVNGLRGF